MQYSLGTTTYARVIPEKSIDAMMATQIFLTMAEVMSFETRLLIIWHDVGSSFIYVWKDILGLGRVYTYRRVRLMACSLCNGTSKNLLSSP